MTTKDVLALALEALEANHKWHQDYDDHGGYPESALCEQNIAAITAIKQAQQAQEPVGINGLTEAETSASMSVIGLSKPAPKQAEPVQEPVTRCGGRGYCDRMPFCGCGGSEGLPERDPTKPAEAQGLFRKFIVQRVDGSDKHGGKHYGCEYFVLDVDHDPHAKAALRAYAQACAESHPQLSADLIAKHGPAPKQAEPEQ